ncbi:OmpA family protein [Shumkonia mesophila]|uniref:OmpA family protein n=1 Tax=Shumkonia mesophila TaxID=2838854 RepID=UPI002934ED1A|nr:OmpA family protein [Shumkonia mesophila]
MESLRKVCAFGAIAAALAGCEGLELGQAGPADVDLAPAVAQQALPGPFMIYFNFDSTKVTAEGQKAVASAAAAVAAFMPAAVIVTGHADRAGPDAYNVELSKRRAEAVALALVQAGVTAGIEIFVANYGEAEPQVPTADGKREPRNRRVSIALRRTSAQLQSSGEGHR